MAEEQSPQKNLQWSDDRPVSWPAKHLACISEYSTVLEARTTNIDQGEQQRLRLPPYQRRTSHKPFHDLNSSLYRPWMFYASLIRVSVYYTVSVSSNYVRYTLYPPFSCHRPEIWRYLFLLYLFSFIMENKNRFNETVDIFAWQSQTLDWANFRGEKAGKLW